MNCIAALTYWQIIKSAHTEDTINPLPCGLVSNSKDYALSILQALLCLSGEIWHMVFPKRKAVGLNQNIL